MIMVLIALGLLAGGTLLLMKGADWFVDGAGDLARALGISALVLGVLLVTLGLAAAIHALPVNPQLTFIALPAMIIAHLMLLAFVWYGKIPRVMGGLLLGAYITYLIAVVRV